MFARALLQFSPLLALATLVAACDSDPTGSEQGSFLQATLQSIPTATVGATTIEHRGGANWSGGTKSETHRHLSVSSRDTRNDRTVMLSRLSSAPGGPFQPGTYSLVPRNFDAGDNDGYTARFFDHGDHYIAESGTWTITSVDEDGVVSGHFEFVATHWCNPHVNKDRCFQSPNDLGFESDAKRLNVRGEFSAYDAGAIEVPGFVGH